jgi:hypothetical protein
VVLVLSKEFITTPFPMEELHLLLERRRMHPESQAVILPVLYNVTWEDVHAKALEYKQAAAAAAAARPMPSANAAAHPDYELMAVVNQQSAGPSAALSEQYVLDLRDLEGITGIRTDQVCRCSLPVMVFGSRCDGMWRQEGRRICCWCCCGGVALLDRMIVKYHM